MKSLVLCARKDFVEFTRHKKNLICLFVLLCISGMVLSVTLFFPSLITELARKAPDMLIDQGSLNEMMAKMFPQDLKGSLGILASDIGVFFTIVAALICFNIIPSEIKEGKWIVPVNCGISRKTLLLAKSAIYSLGIGFPVIVIYNLYFWVASYYLDVNCKYEVAILNSLVLGIDMMLISITVILLSVIYKHSLLAALTVIITVMVAPDVLTLFSFGKVFPTYLLTFTYLVEDDASKLVIPFVAMICILLLLYVFAVRKMDRAEIAR